MLNHVWLTCDFSLTLEQQRVVIVAAAKVNHINISCEVSLCIEGEWNQVIWQLWDQRHQHLALPFQDFVLVANLCNRGDGG